MAILRSVAGAGNGMQIGNPFGFAAGEFVKQAYIDATNIDKLSTSVKSFREPLTLSLNSVVQPAIVANFAAQGRPRWQPLAASTLISRNPLRTTRKNSKARSSGNKILDRTGRLKNIATQKNLWEIRDDQLTFRVVFFTQKVTYGAFHQLGTRNMPARPFISITEPEENRIEDIFELWLQNRIRKYWGGVGE
jgi:phage gpG-like protein